jgi:RHS repeat-associated protein
MEYENSNSQTLAAFNYTLDLAGNRTSMQDNEGVTDYTFDNLNRLTRVDYPDSTFEQFAFDNGSRRIHHEDETGSTSYLYNLGDRLLATTGQNAAAFDYDLNGNLTEKTNNEGTYQYSYSARDRLKAITTPDGSSESYRYYPLSDLRYSLTRNNDSSNTEKYLYGGPNVIEELKQIEGNGSNEFETVASYIEGLSIDEHLGRVIHDTSGEGNPDEVYAYITDPLGTIRNLVDSTESIVNTYDYKAYGNIRNQTGTTPNPYLFTGRRWSETTKDYYYRARNYMPDLGMFGAVDRYAPGEMTYGYVNGNPVMGRDPRGEFAVTTFLFGIAVIATVATIYSGSEAIVSQSGEFGGLVGSNESGSNPCLAEIENQIYSISKPYNISLGILPLPDYLRMLVQINDVLSVFGLEAKITLPSNLIFRDDLDYSYQLNFNEWAKIFNGGLATFKLYKQGRNAWEKRKHQRGMTKRDYVRESNPIPEEGVLLDPKQHGNYPDDFISDPQKTEVKPVNDLKYRSHLEAEIPGEWVHVTEENADGLVITYARHSNGTIRNVSKPHNNRD